MLKFLKKTAKFLFSQRTTIILLLIAQIMFIVFTVLRLSEYANYITQVSRVISIALAVYILNKPENPAYKLAWIIPLMAFPLFATLAYFILSNQYSARAARSAYAKKCASTRPYLKQEQSVRDEIAKESTDVQRLAKYIDNFGGYPVYRNTYAEYYKLGEEKFASMLRELEKAKKFIFMEYFIIDQGEMWDAIEEILVRKAKEGVEVRLLYDGMGSQSLLPFRYDKKLRDIGINCRVFNPFRPMLSSIQNNRDHRKICVIDGNTAFNGGVNLADEYINRKERFGHWKDTAVMIKGDAVWSFTMMFLQMWEVVDSKSGSTDYEIYRPDTHEFDGCAGYVIPYGDSPLDSEAVGQQTYLSIS